MRLSRRWVWPRAGACPRATGTHDAVDADAEHPDGVYVARCGHRLRVSASIDERTLLGATPCVTITRFPNTTDLMSLSVRPGEGVLRRADVPLPRDTPSQVAGDVAEALRLKARPGTAIFDHTEWAMFIAGVKDGDYGL